MIASGSWIFSYLYSAALSINHQYEIKCISLIFHGPRGFMYVLFYYTNVCQYVPNHVTCQVDSTRSGTIAMNSDPYVDPTKNAVP